MFEYSFIIEGVVASLKNKSRLLMMPGHSMPSTTFPQFQRQLIGSLITVTADAATIAVASLVALAIASHDVAASTVVNVTWAAQEPLVKVIFVILGLCMISVMLVRGHYVRPLTTSSALRQIYGAACLAFVVTLTVISASVAPPSLRWLAAIWLVLPPAIIGVRSLVNRLLHPVGLAAARVVVVGTPSGIQNMTAALRSSRSHRYQVAGALDIELMLSPAQSSDPIRRPEMQAVLERFAADSLIVSLHGCAASIRETALDALARETVPFALMPDFGDLPVRGCEVQHFKSDASMMLMFRNNFHHPIRRSFKTLFDRVVAVFAILLLWPFGALVAGLVALDGGPVFFKHTRIGQNGRRFGCLKFRTMTVNSDKILADTLAEDPNAAAEWALTHKLRNDPRVTRVGRILRKTSLDELPQLINVLMGDMSLVGPRPIVDAELVRYGKNMEFYYRCKPGMTGLWQISGRSDTTYDRRVALDAWYAKNWSLWQDFTILLKTVPVLLRREGAV